MSRPAGWRAALPASLFCLASFLAPASVAEFPAIPEKHLNLHVDPERGRLEGEMRLDRPAGPTEFRLLNGLQVDSVRQGNNELAVSRPDAGRYRVEVPTDKLPLEIAWSGQLPHSQRGESPVYMGASGGFFPGRSGWHPEFGTQAPFRLTLDARVPAGQRLVATGSLVGEAEQSEGFYRVRHEHPRVDAVTLATGPWLERSRMVDGVRLRTLFSEGLDADYAETYLEHTADYLRNFTTRLGRFPYGSFTIAETTAPVGVAYPGFTLLGERVIPLPFIPRTSLAHELLHSWWGVGVRVDVESGNWSEALTTYMADYHLDEKRGRARETRQRWLLDLAALPPELDRPLAAFRGGNQRAERIIGYNRGAMVFHMLQRRIGVEAFNAGARLLAERHMFERAGWNDLQAAFSEAAEQDLGAWFAAWVQRPGLPELALGQVEARPAGGGWLVTGILEQVQKAAPWPLDVPLLVETANGGVHEDIRMDQASKRFELRLDERPLAVAADPEHDVLRRMPDPPPILRTVTLDPATRLMPASRGLEGLDRALLGRQAERPAEFAPDQPLILAGLTGDVARWLDEQRVPEPPESVAARGHARMWTVPGTRLLVLSADDLAGMRRLVGALRHHGSRSYLVQGSDGSTLDAGIWESGEEALRVALPE